MVGHARQLHSLGHQQRGAEQAAGRRGGGWGACILALDAATVCGLSHCGAFTARDAPSSQGHSLEADTPLADHATGHLPAVHAHDQLHGLSAAELQLGQGGERLRARARHQDERLSSGMI